MSSYFNLAAEAQCDATDLFFYDDQPMEFDLVSSGLKSIIKKRTNYPHNLEELLAPMGDQKQLGKQKSVVFRDPICSVRLYDKVAAKRQQWGHSTKFSRVKRFCWGKEEDLESKLETTRQEKQSRWLPNETDQDYRLMMWRDMQQRRLNRKRRSTGESLAFLVQGLEISPNCIEEVSSKMRRMEERV